MSTRLKIRSILLSCIPMGIAHCTPRKPQDMVFIPAGEFTMGSTVEDIQWIVNNLGGIRERYEDELPQHKVYLDAFYIDKYEVSNKQFEEFVNATNYVTETEKGVGCGQR